MNDSYTNFSPNMNFYFKDFIINISVKMCNLKNKINLVLSLRLYETGCGVFHDLFLFVLISDLRY